jgi:hypothetical protein
MNKAYVFRRPTQPDDTHALLWAARGKTDLVLPVTPERVTLMRPFGTRLRVATKGGKAVIPVGNRKYLRLKGMGTEQAVQTLRRGE